MNVDFDSLHKILKDQTRRNIVLHLSKKGQLAYVELMNILEITNTGKINYHLKILGNLIEKGEDGKYRLTERGQLASQMLQKFPEEIMEAKPLRMADALLIGVVGSLFLLAFPGTFAGLSILGLVGTFLSAFIYALFVPGAVMWWLTIRRAKTHDFYDLFKPPLVPLALMIAWAVLVLLQRVSFIIELSYTTGPTTRTAIQFTMISFLILGFFPFIGVIITESLHRVSRHG
jgi:hypothetical protein